MKRNQNGFAVIEGLLILVILVILGFTGWYVYHSQKTSDNSYNNSVASSSQTVTGTKKSTTAQSQSGTSAAASGCSLALTTGQRDGAAGTFHMDLVFTNKGSGNCALNGYPKVTLLDSSGSQIGQPASQDTSVSATAITLKPNESAYASLSLPDHGIAPNCSNTPSAQVQAVVTGLSVTLKTADTQDYYCPNFMVRPFAVTP